MISESGSGSLNLRGGPSISAVSVTQLKDGQQLQVVAETNACTNANGGCWVKVQVGGLTGYVSNAYLQKGHVRDRCLCILISDSFIGDFLYPTRIEMIGK